MDKDRYEKGLEIRRQVLGAEYVDRALQNVGDFDRQFQTLVTEMAWGECWGDPTLGRKERSILNLGMLAALGRMHEFEPPLPRRDQERAHPRPAPRGADPDRGLLRDSVRRRVLPDRQEGPGGDARLSRTRQTASE